MDVEKNTHLTISWDLHDKKFHQNTSNFAIFKKKENPNVFFVSNKLANSLTFFRRFSLIQFFMDQLPHENL